MNHQDILLIKTDCLTPHPLSLQVYGGEETLEDLLLSIRNLGILHILPVTPSEGNGKLLKFLF